MKVPNLTNWYISYNPYTDFFQIYNKDMLKFYKNELKQKKRRGVSFYFNKNKLILIEVNDIYNRFGKDIDNLEKKEVVNLIRPLIKSYV